MFLEEPRGGLVSRTLEDKGRVLGCLRGECGGLGPSGPNGTEVSADLRAAPGEEMAFSEDCLSARRARVPQLPSLSTERLAGASAETSARFGPEGPEGSQTACCDAR